MRLFTAVTMPENIIATLEKTQGELRQSLAGVRWVKPANLHLTLLFLGEVPEARLDEVKAALAGVRARRFGFSLGGLGAFPEKDAPRVVWAGARQGAEALTRLAGGVRGALSPLGFKPEEKDFTPHLTLGRVSYFKTKKPPSFWAAWSKKEFGSMTVSEFCLMKSDLRPAGSVYHVLERFALDEAS